MSLDELRYARVWEDSRLLEQALVIQPDDDVLSIASAGDNVLALLLMGPRSVTAIDMSPAQTALLQLKLTAIGMLKHDELAILVGERDGEDRWALYQRIRGELPGYCKAHWDERRDEIDAGICRQGRLERYFAKFQADHLAALMPAELVAELLSCETVEAQQEIYDRLPKRELEATIGWFFGRQMLARHGRHEAQFEHVTQSDIGGFFYRRFEHACTSVHAKGNHYLEAFLTNRYADLERGPEYLRPSTYAKLQASVSRVKVVTGELEQYLTEVDAGSFSKANMSDVFEYMSLPATERMFAIFAERMRAGGRLAYWNLLVPRAPSSKLQGKLQSRRNLARALWREDRAFFYGDFHVEEVLS